ncbi:MAG: DUF1501 domain-containing protein [Planctomycetaceae bacterium]|nr:DUF1501 domain-containing protein [Planctomycetaceae bacterium]
MPNPIPDFLLPRDQVNRRAFLSRASLGLGAVALAALVPKKSLSPIVEPRSPNSGDFRGMLVHAPRAGIKTKRVIWLYMAGGMSHIEGWDPKPVLARMNGEKMPESITTGQQIAQLQGAELNCLGPQHPFKKWGKSGLEFSSLFPEIGSQAADDLCIVRSMHTDAINHDPAHTLMNTGSMVPGRPSMGSWLLYGLGSECDDLPGFVVMVSTGNYGQKQPIAARQWHSGFLPSRHQGVEFRSQGDAVLYVQNPKGVSREQQRDVIDSINQINSLSSDAIDDPEVATRIAQYEMAFKMQSSVPGLMDLSDEPKHVLDLYGTQGADGSFAANCLLARRLAEQGTRFIQLYHRDWDHHGQVKSNFAGTAAEVDRGTAALLTDLKQRGMLDETLVVFGTEFGRTPMAQGLGRDHHLAGFSMWLAGGGVKGGMAYGATDELGYHAVENKTHVNDIHATILHLLGIDHLRLTYRFQGRDFRLTDVAGRVINEIMA